MVFGESFFDIIHYSYVEISWDVVGAAHEWIGLLKLLDPRVEALVLIEKQVGESLLRLSELLDHDCHHRKERYSTKLYKDGEYELFAGLSIIVAIADRS